VKLAGQWLKRHLKRAGVVSRDKPIHHDFEQLDDEEVIRLLEAAHSARQA
jgi:hypothetical protein